MLDAVAAVLAEYPEEVIQQVTDPRTGLPGRMKFPPAVAEVREACEILMAPITAARDRKRRNDAAQRQIAERERLADFYRQAPKVDLKARHGENYGLNHPGLVKAEDARRKHIAAIVEANRRLYGRSQNDQ